MKHAEVSLCEQITHGSGLVRWMEEGDSEET